MLFEHDSEEKKHPLLFELAMSLRRGSKFKRQGDFLTTWKRNIFSERIKFPQIISLYC